MGPIRNILVEVPETDSTPACFEKVKELALREKARVTLLTTLPSFSDLFSFFDTDSMRDDLQDDLEIQTRTALKNHAAELEAAGIHCNTIVTKGKRERELIVQVIHDQHDFVIKDTAPETDGVFTIYSSLDHKLIRHSPCPVWFVREDLSKSSEDIVVAVDANFTDSLHFELNERLIRYGARIANLFDRKLHLIHVIDFDDTGLIQGSVSTEKYLEIAETSYKNGEERLEQFIKKMPIKRDQVTAHLLKGTPNKKIVEYCREQEVNTLIIGTVGRAGLSGYLIGNTAEYVLSKVSCSVLVASPKQIPSPLEVKLREEIGDQDDFAFA